MKKLICLILSIALISSLAVIVSPASTASAATGVAKKFVIDGYLDPYYMTAENQYSWEYVDAWQGASGHDPYYPSHWTDQASVWTAYDKNYVYVYVQVHNDRDPYMEWDDSYAAQGVNSSMVDSIAIWMDLDPYTQKDDHFYKNTSDPAQTDTQFRFLVADQRWHDYHDCEKRGITPGVTFGNYLKDPANTAFRYIDEDDDGSWDGYALEVRYPRIVPDKSKGEIEDCYHFNVVANFSSCDDDDNYCMALAPDWWISYQGTPKIFFNDANNPFFSDSRTDIDLSGVASVNTKVAAIPDVSTLTYDNKAAVMEVYNEYQALEPSYQALVDNSKKLIDAYNKVKDLEPPTPSVIYGDVDGNKTVDAADALMALQASISKVTLTEAQKVAADVDLNKVVDAADSLLILQKSIGKVDKLPVVRN